MQRCGNSLGSFYRVWARAGYSDKSMARALKQALERIHSRNALAAFDRGDIWLTRRRSLGEFDLTETRAQARSSE
jgi:hypothetical protein